MTIIPSIRFLADIKKLLKKYKRVEDDIQPVINQLKSGQIIGTKLEREDMEIYKVRIRNSDARRGKSGGYRLLYYVHSEDTIGLLSIYSKLGK